VLATAAPAAAQARAALALTRPECVPSDLSPRQAHEWDGWRAQVLERVDSAGLPGYVHNRIAMRRSHVWGALAWQHARWGQAEASAAAARRALGELASVRRAELLEADAAAWNDAVMQANASRWAAVPAPEGDGVPAGPRPSVLAVPGEPGQTCVLLVDGRHGPERPLARRCTHAHVWLQSASVNREGNAVALAVQPAAGWRELWLFRRARGGAWAVEVLPPGAVTPGLGYAEFAGWVPGGQQVLVAREARGEGRYRRQYEVVSLDSLAVQRQAPEASALGPFQRWADPQWKRLSPSVR